MSNRLMYVVAYELRRNFRRKGYLFTTFGVPLLAIVLLLSYQFISSRAAGEPESPLESLDLEGIRKAGYVDLSGMFDQPGELADALARYPDEAAARAALDAGEFDVYYVIAADYLDTGSVTLVMPRMNVSDISTGLIERFLLNTLAQGVDDKALFNRLVNPSSFEEINLQQSAPPNVRQSSDGAFLVVYIFAITLTISVFMTNSYLLQSVIEEKETRLVEILIASVRPAQLLAGKILAMGLLGLLQMGVWVAGIVLIIRLSAGGAMAGQAAALLASFYITPGLIPLLVVYFVLAYLMFAAGFSIIGALSNSMREGPQYAGIFTLPAVIPLWFTQLFATTPDAPLATFLSLFPITAPLAMVQRLAISTVPAWQVALSIGLQALTVVGAMWLAGRAFRVQTLLAGQMPRLRDLPKLLKG